MSTPRFSIIVPCYNEKDAVRNTIESLQGILKDVGSYELIIVDDGSNDGSAHILKMAVEENPQLRVITHPVNRGYGAALKTGIRRAASEVIVITDADGTYPNERIGEFIEVAENVDMVVGARIADNVTYPLSRKLGKVFLQKFASWLVGQHIPDMNSGLRVFRKSIVERYLRILPDGFSFTTTITLAMLRNNYNVQFIPIDYYPRIGKSKIRPVRDMLRFIQLIIRTGVYFAPLRIFLPIAGMLSILFAGSLMYDLMTLHNLTDKTIILLMFTLNTTLFALLGDMIDKRIG